MVRTRAGADDLAARVRQLPIGGAGSVAPGSSLAKDDAACRLLPCSRIAWGCLVRAHADLLRALAAPDDEARDVPVPVDGAALRDALISVSHALTVLSPPRSERTTYGLRMAWTTLSNATDSPALIELVPFTSPIALREVTRLLTDRGFHASPRWTDASSVKVAGAVVGRRTSDPDAFEHAVRALWRNGARIDEDELAVATEAVAVMLEHAVQLWQSRREAPTPAARSPYPGRVRFLLSTTPGDPPVRSPLGGS